MRTGTIPLDMDDLSRVVGHIISKWRTCADGRKLTPVAGSTQVKFASARGTPDKANVTVIVRGEVPYDAKVEGGYRFEPNPRLSPVAHQIRLYVPQVCREPDAWHWQILKAFAHEVTHAADPSPLPDYNTSAKAAAGDWEGYLNDSREVTARLRDVENEIERAVRKARGAGISFPSRLKKAPLDFLYFSQTWHDIVPHLYEENRRRFYRLAERLWRKYAT